MSINSKCYLPSDVRANDVIEAVAFLCGAERERVQIGHHADCIATWSNRHQVSKDIRENDTRKFKVYVLPTYDIQYVTIHIAPTNCDNEWHQGSLFLYPQENHPNRIMLHAGVSEFWRQIDRALVVMFGGEVDDNDCDDVDIDYAAESPRSCNCPEDGEPWQEFQDAMYNLPTLFHFLKD